MYITKKVEYLLGNLENVENCKVFVEDSVDIPANLSTKHEFVKTKTPQKDYAEYVTSIFNEKAEKNSKRKYTFEKGYWVGENVAIGENALIEPGCVIDHDVTIGKNAVIKTGAKIREAIIGDDFIACENCTIGTTGFTMAGNDEGNKIRIPTLGKVIIGNNVEIGALSNISCGSAGNTILEDNVKLDSLVNIGHDVYVGKNVEFPAGAIVGGFASIQDNAYISMNTTIRNRITIGEKAFVGMGSVVTKSVEPGITVIGNPAKELIRKQ